jgi:hypothetical protein
LPLKAIPMSNVFLLYVIESFKEKDGVERVLSPSL